MLATATASRAEFDPALPAVAEYLPGFEATAWHGILAPARTPRPVIAALACEIGALMRQPATQARFRDLGAAPPGRTSSPPSPRPRPGAGKG